MPQGSAGSKTRISPRSAEDSIETSHPLHRRLMHSRRQHCRHDVGTADVDAVGAVDVVDAVDAVDSLVMLLLLALLALLVLVMLVLVLIGLLLALVL